MNVSAFPSPRDVPDSAEGWLARLLSPECDARDHAAFEDWLAASPSNAADYAEVERIHRLVGELMHDPVPAGARHGPPDPVPATRTRRNRALPPMAWAAILFLAIGGGLWFWRDLRPPAPARYATAVGEQRSVVLADGSGLVLDTDTSVQVRYTRSSRQVALLRGRLQATVARDAGRPFVVLSGTGRIHDLGTVFQVERRGGDTVVRLLQGRVAVSTPRAARAHALRPLQQLHYDADGRFGDAVSIDRAEAEGWTRGRLVFKARRLADLLAETNRYSRRRLTLEDAALGEIRVSGAFDAADQASLLEALRRGWGLRAKRVADDEIALFLSE